MGGAAPAAGQRARVLPRTGMTEAKMGWILARQLPDAEKRRRADFVVQTGLGKRHSLRQLAGIVRLLRPGGERRRRAWRPGAALKREVWCARSFSTPKPPASIRPPATASSHSPPRNCCTISSAATTSELPSLMRIHYPHI